MFDNAVRAAGFDKEHYTYLNDASAICTDIGKFHYVDENDKYMCIFSMGHTYSMAIVAHYSRKRNGNRDIICTDVERVEYSTYACGRLFSKYFLGYAKDKIAENGIDLENDILAKSSSGTFHSIIEKAKQEILLEDYGDTSLQMENLCDAADVDLSSDEFLAILNQDQKMHDELNKLMNVFRETEEATRSRRNNKPLYICMCGGASRSIIVQNKLKELSKEREGFYHLSRILNEDECVARGLSYSFEGASGRIPELDLIPKFVRNCLSFESMTNMMDIEDDNKHIVKELKIFDAVEKEKEEFEEAQDKYCDRCATRTTDV